MHFCFWPLIQAVQAGFVIGTWPEQFPAPQGSIDFEMRSPQAVEARIQGLSAKGHELIHIFKKTVGGRWYVS